MSVVIEYVAKLLMYRGPQIDEMIRNAVASGNEYSVIDEVDCKKLRIKSIGPYNLVIEDVFYYNLDQELIKQTLFLNGRETVIFDKFYEAMVALKLYENSFLAA